MRDWEVWASRWDELGLYLHRQFWRPLRSMMNIFHVLPLAAVVILFVFLATDGQFREIYIALLEGARSHTRAWLAGVVMAFAALTLISAVLYEAHNALSTMRINVVYSSYSDPTAGSNLRALQRAAAFVLAFLPWVGLSVGLLGARDFVADRYCHLLNSAGIPGDALEGMQYLPIYGGYRIACGVAFLGLAVAYFSSVGEQHRMAQRAVACLAVPVGALLFFLFTDLFNVGHRTFGTIIADIVIVALTVFYFLIYQRLYRRRRGFIFSNLSSGTGVSLRRRRRLWLAMWAFVPWLALAVYFVCAQYLAGPVAAVVEWRHCPVASHPTPGRWAIFPVAMCVTIAIGLIVGHTLGRLSAHKWRRPAIWAIVALLVLAVELLSFFGGVDRAVYVYRFIGPLGTVLLELLFLISTFALLAVLSQRSGFPALTLAVLTMVVSVMFPNYAGLTAIALAAVYLLFAVAGFLSRQYAVGFVGLLLPLIVLINWNPLRSEALTSQNRQPVATVDSNAVTLRFQCWLAFRGVASGAPAPDCSPDGTPPPAASGAGKYPVFIIAAEGGGIYAASAVSTLLAKLQDAVPQFSKHIFAISGVSGGSLGAAVFRALDHPLTPAAAVTAQKVQPPANNVSNADDATTCAQYQSTARPPAEPSSASDASSFLQREVANIMRADHFSPVVGAIVPEIFGAPLSRSKALVASFDYSTSAQDAEAGKQLCAPFRQSWSPAGDAPALVLNSTWVETGFRVAFAPFDLHATDESLYSFSDVGMPNEQQANLMSAASVSARFPLIMPPFSVAMQSPDKANPKRMDTKRWNFVDGAYSDNSGASTAIDIYRAIKDTPNVDLHVILITSTNPAPNLDDTSINGTVFRDTVAPLDALMKVRSDLGDQAVARACTYIYASAGKERNSASASAKETNAYCVNQSWDKAGAPLQIVEIQDQTYGLALGWKISATTFAVVKWMLGRPDGCVGPDAAPANSDDQSAAGTETSAPSEASSDPGSAADQAAAKKTTPVASAEDPNAQLTKDILRRNSCVLTSVANLVRNAEAGASSNKTGQ